MNSHILVGYGFDKTHRVVLDGAPYAQIKKVYNETKQSGEFSKLEIWSRANGLEKSKRLKRAAENAEEVSAAENVDTDDFKIETPAPEEQSGKKRKPKSS
nr:MAG TPA: hypothetical protein [Caudoviricetes sp.]